jgi:hypothetical protein
MLQGDKQKYMGLKAILRTAVELFLTEMAALL